MPDTAPRRVLVVGATGVFGARLVTGLLQTTSLQIIAAGRSAPSLARIQARSPDRITTLVLDARAVLPATLAATGAFAVVDAAGPYQGGDYHLAKATIAAGLHFIDLADARDHVAGFTALDPAARAAGVVALTGASSTPALSTAVLDTLTAGWTRVDAAAIAISPGNRAPRGLSVMRSILSYAGSPVRVFDGGRWGAQPGWGMTVRRTMPGLGRRWLSLSETPDLDIVPHRYAVRRSAVFRAGLELPVLHLGLWAASLPVRWGWLRSLRPFARPFRVVAALFEPFGSDRGGMTVEALGADRRGPVQASWALVALAGDGLFIPTLPALAVLRALANVRPIEPGARPCVGVLSLPEIEAEFAGRRITAGAETARPPASLYQRVLGPHFGRLPDAVRRIHDPGWSLHARGLAKVEGGTTRLARATARLFGFPPATASVEVTVDILPDAGRERWTRRFGGRPFTSELSQAARPGRVWERFGPLRFELDLQTDRSGVAGMPVRRWRFGPLPLPLPFAPRSSATETVDAEGRFRFDVALHLPFNLGRIVRYSGWLQIVD